jgi:hypothetical protein
MVTLAQVHPAERRRMEARMPPPPAHEVILRPLGAGQARDVITTITAQQPVPALFDDLKATDWRSRLAELRRLRTGVDGILELGQPIHRRFQFALFEAVCDRPGHPRLDPAKIESAGIVIRRRRGLTRMGWLRASKSIKGWQTLLDSERDPDPARAGAGHPANAALRELAAARRAPVEPLEETSHTLFTAPPEVCAALGRTVLFAPISVVSSEVSDEPPPRIDFLALGDLETAELIGHLSSYLKYRGQPKALPLAGSLLRSEWNVLSSETRRSNGDLYAFGLFLHQCASELDLFGPGPAAQELRRLLSGIELPLEVDESGRTTSSIDVTSFARDATAILLAGEPNEKNVSMPLSWPGIDGEKGAQLSRAALACLSDQHARVAPRLPKFSNDAHQYVVRGFIRVKRHDHCPEKLVWSVESEPFRIAPWWDGDGPGITINLPDLGKLKKTKPSVSFAMPAEIANVLQGDPLDLSEGKGSKDGPGIAWLCSFSIPYITICAFIVLNIFLSLLNLIFQWMLYIKICIPIPAASSGDDGGGG